MKRYAAYIILIFTAIVFASSAPLWEITLPVRDSSLENTANRLSGADSQTPSSPPSLSVGHALYFSSCAGCHNSGENIPAAEPLETYFTRQDYSPRDIHQLITWGHSIDLPGNFPWTGSKFELEQEHPAYPAKLTDFERWSLATYVYLMPFDTEGNWDTRMDRLKERVEGDDYGRTRDLYENFCASCHGIKGYGDGPLARDLVPPPRNLADSVWMAGQSNKYLFDVIRNGKRISSSDSGGESFIGGMPWFGDYFGTSSIGGLIDYIRSFSFEFTSAANPVSALEEGSEEIEPDYNDMTWSYIRRRLENSPAKPPEWLGNGHEP